MTFKELRKSKGYRTAAELAAAVGIKHMTVAKWDSNGARPKYEHLIALAKLFGMTSDEIISNCFVK